jgi:FkbM family methyltransferase
MRMRIYMLISREKHVRKEIPCTSHSVGSIIDVGAFSPMECPNTHVFYRHGWNGINIDAMPGVMDSFTRLCKRDVNLNIAIGGESRELTFYSWGTPNVFNTADPELARQGAESLGRQPNEVNVHCMKLADVLERCMPSGTHIDFLTVDVKGLDLDVLQSNNWEKYRPELVVAEDYSSSLE